MKKILLIGAGVVLLALGAFAVLMLTEPKIPEQPIIEITTPANEVIEATPEPIIEILEEEQKENVICLEFHTLLDVLTVSQYNYVMISLTDYFDALYQIKARNYVLSQYKTVFENLFNTRFRFGNDAKLQVPVNKFMEAYTDSTQSCIMIFDATSLTKDSKYYKFSIDIFVDREKTGEFDVEINKKDLKILVK